MSGDVAGSPRGHLASRRAGSFGDDADLYDRVRPGYPAALAAALGARPGLRVLDVGCGTGKSSEAFVAAGCTVLGLDPDPRMAMLGRERGLVVELGSFEQWEPAGRRFDLVIAGQSWHWVDPFVGPAKAAALLAPGGHLAPFWNYRQPSGALRARLDPVYLRHAPALLQNSPMLGTVDQAEELARYSEAIAAAGLFEGVSVARFPWSTTMTTDEWLGLTRTLSDHRLLGEAEFSALLADIEVALANAGPWTVSYESVALVAELKR